MPTLYHRLKMSTFVFFLLKISYVNWNPYDEDEFQNILKYTFLLDKTLLKTITASCWWSGLPTTSLSLTLYFSLFSSSYLSIVSDFEWFRAVQWLNNMGLNIFPNNGPSHLQHGPSHLQHVSNTNRKLSRQLMFDINKWSKRIKFPNTWRLCKLYIIPSLYL